MGFRLKSARVEPMTPALAEKWVAMPPSPTERELDPKRVKHLTEKAQAGHLVTFHWAFATVNGEPVRINGQHSGQMLHGLDGSFPSGLMAHIDEYEVDSPLDLAVLFRQIDDRKSARTLSDVSGAYQGLHEALKDVDRRLARTAIEAINWFRREIEGIPGPSQDEQFTLFNNESVHPFLQWLPSITEIGKNSKTPELNPHGVVAAIYTTFCRNEEDATAFWQAVGHGGDQYDETDPAAVLDTFLRDALSDTSTTTKRGTYFHACVYCWNAHRQHKPVERAKLEKELKGSKGSAPRIPGAK